VNEDGIELAGYFRERHRADSGFLGRAFIELSAGRGTAASVLLRGTEGFGAGQPHAGRSLPLAEDAPLTATAVGTRRNIEALLDEALRLAGAGLVTLAPLRLLTGEIAPVWLGENADEATRLTLYCGRQDRVYQEPAFEAACELLYRREIAGATVLSGADGTYLGRRQHAQFPHHGTDAPLVITAVGAGERIAMLLPELGGMFRNPLMTVAKVSLCKRDGELITRPHLAAGENAAAGMTALVKLTVYTSEATRHDGQPVHRAIIHRLRSAGLSGATSIRGVWGFHADHAPHGDHFPHRGHHVPVVTTVIDTPELIFAAFDVVDALTKERGLVTAETVLTPHRAAVPHDHQPDGAPRREGREGMSDLSGGSSPSSPAKTSAIRSAPARS
jgi:PII-like signaling protein